MHIYLLAFVALAMTSFTGHLGQDSDKGQVPIGLCCSNGLANAFVLHMTDCIMHRSLTWVILYTYVRKLATHLCICLDALNTSFPPAYRA